MALPFRRARRTVPGAEDVPVCSFSSPEQRLWEVQALLCTLSPQVQRVLFAWLLLPTDLHRWPPPPKFSQRREPISDADLGDDALATCLRLLREELSALR